LSLTRRELLQLTAGYLAVGPVLSGCSEDSESSPSNLILGGGRYQNLDTGETAHVFSIVDLGSREVSLVDLDFLAHGIHLHSKQPHRMAVFEKKGPHAIEFDLRERQVVRRITTAKNRYFYGHGVYSVDGSLLFCTESYLDTLRGIIAVRDAETHRYLGEFPSYGKEPHECKLIEQGRTLVVTNGGGSGLDHAPSVAYIDVASEKLIERVTMTDVRINTGHFAVGGDGALVVISAPRRGLETTEPGGVSIRPRGASMLTLSKPQQVAARMQGEALSVAIHEESNVAAVTHPDGGMVTFWSIADRRLLKVIDLAHPRGVVLTRDNRFFVLSYGLEASLVRVAVADLNLVKDSLVPNTLISGSHLYNWSRGPTEILAPGPLT
jgi:hypothetical protein